MNAATRFANALDADRCSGRGEPELLPDRLVRAAVVALPVDGAVLSVQGKNLRIPLAASSEVAATAERLECTVGCGPYVAAAASGFPLVASQWVLARRWPILHDLLVTKTAFRSVVALPLPGRLRGVGAMDLYFRDPAGPTAIDVVEAHLVAALVDEQLASAAGWSAGAVTGEPSWLATPAARRRWRLGIAVGMVIAALRVSDADALAVLRGHAYALDSTVDGLADDLLERRVDPDELRAGGLRPPTGPASLVRRAAAPAGRHADRRPVRQRSRGADVVGSTDRDIPAAWDGHVLLLYSGERERQAGLTAWVRRGLELGEKVVCAEPVGGPRQLLSSVLDAGGVDVTAAVRDGQLDVVPLEDFDLPEGQRVVVERALAEGFPGVRLAADVRAALTVLPPADYREHERQMDELVHTKPVSVLCQYARSMTTGAWLPDVVAAHLTGVHQSTLATGGNADGDGLVLRGEIDAANADVFAALLAAADPADAPALCLDLAGVTYLDAGAGRLFNDATRRFRAAGGQVRLVAPQPPVERTLRLLDFGDLPGMQLVGGNP